MLEEMLATPQFVRFCFPYQDGSERHPTIVIKAHSLTLKYIAQDVPLKLFFFMTKDGHCIYGIHVRDDLATGFVMWSLLTKDDEVIAVKDLAKHGRCSIYLFNEACVNCAWTSVTIDIGVSILEFVDAALLDNADPAKYADELSVVHKQVDNGTGSTKTQADIKPTAGWKALQSHFILNGVRVSRLNLLSDNEGSYQEQLAHTLLGDLSPRGAYPNPQRHEPNGNREFTDLLLTHEYGTILLESKTLSILEQRTKLPDRAKLLRNIDKSAEKGFKQLKGAARKLRDNVPVFDEQGKVIELEREQPPHAIILVPELDLLAEKNENWFDRVVEFAQETGGFLHILDTVQLFQMMQAARMISDASHSSTPMMAFDAYLIEHFKLTANHRSIHVRMLLQLRK